MEREAEKKKNYYEGEISKIRASRVSLVIALLVEGFILLMHNPGFLGAAWIKNAMTAVRDFLVAVLWPAHPGDMATYKGTIYQICRWFRELPAFELLVRVMIYALPVLLVMSFVRVWILKRQISALEKPPRGKKIITIPKREKKEGTPGLSIGNRWESGVFASAANEANSYCEKVRENCDDPFMKEPGVRVQRISGEIGLGEHRDFVIPWDDNGEINLSVVLRTNARLVLEKNGVFLYKQNVKSKVSLVRYVPILCDAGSDNKTTTICAITWLGG